MVKIFVPLKLARANPQECNPVPVFGVKVGMYFENESAEFIFFRRFEFDFKLLLLAYRTK